MKVSVGSIASKKKIKFITAHNGKLGFNYSTVSGVRGYYWSMGS